jgi:hypothetical protein
MLRTVGWITFPTKFRTDMTPYHTLVLWFVLFVCAAGVAASPMAFAGLWAKWWFRIVYFIALLFLAAVAVRGILIQGRPWIGF